MEGIHRGIHSQGPRNTLFSQKFRKTFDFPCFLRRPESEDRNLRSRIRHFSSESDISPESDILAGVVEQGRLKAEADAIKRLKLRLSLNDV